MLKLRELRKRTNMTLKELGRELGIAESTISQYENGRRQPDNNTLVRIAEYFCVSVDYLIGRSDVMSTSPDFADWDNQLKTPAQTGERVPNLGEEIGEVVVFPILVSVRAGFGREAVESYGDETETVPKSMLGGFPREECRVLLVAGNSMYPRICNGDKVLLHLQSSVDSGSVAVVVYGDEEATIKTVRYTPGEDWLELIPTNPEYETKRIEGADLERCHVVGKVIRLIRDF